jgi:hypothetical protein
VSVFQPGGGFKPEADWGNTIWGGRNYSVTPRFGVSVPLDRPDLHHKWIALQTSMVVNYPSSNCPGAGFFERFPNDETDNPADVDL